MNTITIRVFSLNAWGVPGAKDRRARMTAIGQAIAALQVDIAALQEVWLEADRQALLASLPDPEQFHIHYFPVANSFGSGLMVISRFPLARPRFLPFRANGDPKKWREGDFYGGKGIGVIQALTPLGPIEIFNLHTVAQYQPDQEDVYRGQRAAQLYKAVQAVEKRPGAHPALLVGDLNTRPEQFGYQLLTAVGGLKDAYAALFPRQAGFTFSSQNPYLPIVQVEERIDYILYQNGKAVSAIPQTVQIITHPQGEAAPPAFSDHFGLLATFELRPLPLAKQKGRRKNHLHWTPRSIEAFTSEMAHGLKYALLRRKNSLIQIISSVLLALSLGLFSRNIRRGAFIKTVRLLLAGTMLWGWANSYALSHLTVSELIEFSEILSEMNTLSHPGSSTRNSSAD